eukprot:TRINITY_DN2809_c0_g1_i1.p1 TRINITY_DN2809_c0_g1~~TRINITY_DN2809_c0_g1_i1.p1  ORF type:complete len:644 (+),score=133.02 TRINITY_DN2809_c0_g1_i1:160-2091(+)
MAAAVMASANHKGAQEFTGFDVGHKYIRVIARVFRRLDEDGVGVLGHFQLQQLWRAVLPGLPENDLLRLSDEIYQDLDPNHDGHVSWPEVEKYFLGGAGEGPTDVDKMITETVVEQSPNCREIVWQCVEPDAPRFAVQPSWLPTARRVVGGISNVAILISIINFIVESLPEQYVEEDQQSNSSTPYVIEACCIGVFTVEFIVRLLATPSLSGYWTNFFTWVDILAIAPFYAGVALGSNPSGALVVLRVLRLLRLLRMLKLGRQFEAVQVLVIAIGRTIYPLMVSMVGVNAVAVTLFGSLIVTAERDQASFDKGIRRWVRDNTSKYEDAGTEIAFQSIPVSMWWAWVTLTTVGYGDMYPVTGAGRAIASVAMCSGLVLMAFPLTLLASAFAETTEELHQKKLSRLRGELFKQKLRKYGLSPNADERTIELAVKHATRGHTYDYADYPASPSGGQLPQNQGGAAWFHTNSFNLGTRGIQRTASGEGVLLRSESRCSTPRSSQKAKSPDQVPVNLEIPVPAIQQDASSQQRASQCGLDVSAPEAAGLFRAVADMQCRMTRTDQQLETIGRQMAHVTSALYRMEELIRTGTTTSEHRQSCTTPLSVPHGAPPAAQRLSRSCNLPIPSDPLPIPPASIPVPNVPSTPQ